MCVILSEAKDPSYEAWIAHVELCGQRGLREVPRRLRGSG
jgi:hypothetical protein